MHQHAPGPDQTARKLITGCIVNTDHIVGCEFSFGADDAFRQQTFPTGTQSHPRPVIHNEDAGRLLEKCDPAFPAFQLTGLGEENGAEILAGNDAGDGVSPVAMRNDQRDAGPSADFSRVDFRFHTADAGDAVGATGEGFDFAGDFRDDRHELFRAIEETVHVRENDKQVGIDERGRERTEPVIVAEFDFFDGDGVVFVDDRNDAPREQRVEGFAGAEVPGARFEVVVREENLGDVEIEFAENIAIERHEFALANGGGGLEFRQEFGALGEPERAHAGGNRTRSDENHFLPLFAQRGHLPGEAFDGRDGEPVLVVRQKASAKLDDDAANVTEDFTTQFHECDLNSKTVGQCRVLGASHSLGFTSGSRVW